MKNIKKILLGSLVLFSLCFALAACVAEVGGPGPWYHDGPWMYGGHWGGGYDVHPPGFRR